MGPPPDDDGDPRAIDPSALLLGVVAVAVTMLLGAGAWTIEDSIVALVVLWVMVAFYGRRFRAAQALEEMAYFGVLWLVIITVFAWPAQLAVQPECRWLRPGPTCSDSIADIGTLAAALIATALIVRPVFRLWPEARHEWDARKRARAAQTRKR